MNPAPTPKTLSKTSRAAKSWCLRSMPTWPTKMLACSASTALRITRAFGSGIGGVVTSGFAPPVQSPNAFSTSAWISVAGRSDTIASVAFFGTKNLAWWATICSRVTALTDSAVPFAERPSGCPSP